MKNDLNDILITDINPDGNGVGHLPDGKIVFVPLTVTGDYCNIKIIKENKTQAIGKLVRIITPSNYRVTAECDVYSQCGSCCFSHLSYEYELLKKQNIVEMAFKRIGKIEKNICSTVSVNEYFYRNKVIYPIINYEGSNIVGYYARRTHKVIPHEKCNLEDPMFNEIAMFHVKQSNFYHIPAWDESKETGILRHIAIRKNTKNQYLVCIIASKKLPYEMEIASELMNAFPIIGVSININRENTNVIFGDKTINILGSPFIVDTICGKEFKISPVSFYQINHDCAEKIYNDIRNYISTLKNSIILDLYCGIGTIGLTVKRKEDFLFGVEIVPDAVANAEDNANLNKEENNKCTFVCCDAEKGIDLCHKKYGKPDVIIVDPPRKGLSDDLIRLILDEAPEHLVYLSCDPATLAFNVGQLIQGYQIIKVIPYNMFPKTGHVETLVIFEKIVSRETKGSKYEN